MCVERNSIINIEPTTQLYAELEEINISYNDLRSVPQYVFSTKIVDISHNKIKCLPACIWKSKSLNILNVSNNELVEITFPKSSCTSVHYTRTSSFTSKGKRKLSAEGNPSVLIHKNGKEMNECYTNGLDKLDLSYNKLTSLPTDLACFASNLQRLNISGNNISVLYICLLPPCLKYLAAVECKLECIKTSYDTVLLCHHKTHTSLSNLAFLHLKGNVLQDFTFKGDVQDTRERRLIFPELVTLDLSNNQLSNRLDPNIGLQKHLTTLILSDNPNLKFLPLELSHLSNNLGHLALDNLPSLRDLPKEYILTTCKSPKRFLSYMKSRMKRYIRK